MRLAHCSDLHLLSHDGTRWLELANKRWLGALNLLSNRSRHYHVAAFEAMVANAGFVRTNVEPMLGGLVAIHSGWKI